MNEKQVMAVSKDGHSISIYDVESGNFLTTLFITAGQIIGQPTVTSTTVSVTYIEGQKTYTKVFSNPSFTFLRIIQNSI